MLGTAAGLVATTRGDRDADARCCRAAKACSPRSSLAAGRTALDAAVAQGRPRRHAADQPELTPAAVTSGSTASIGQALEAPGAGPGRARDRPHARRPADPGQRRRGSSREAGRPPLFPGSLRRVGARRRRRRRHTWTCPGARAASAATALRRPQAGAAAAGTDLAAQEPFNGVHQSGILNPAPAQATFVALDSHRARTARTLTAGAAGAHASARASSPRAGRSRCSRSTPRRPTRARSGPTTRPDALTVTIGFGASLFDDRYGLAPSGRAS